jgi:hypothetical protein
MSSPRVDSPAKYRFEDRFFFIVLPLLVPGSVASWFIHHYHVTPRGWLAVACVLLFNLPFLAFGANFVLYFREETDEFQSQLLSRALLWGTGVTLLVTMLWGAMEQFGLVPIMPVRWVGFLFMVPYVIVLSILRRRYR